LGTVKSSIKTKRYKQVAPPQQIPKDFSVLNELPSILLVIGKSRLQRSHMLVEKQHENEYAGSSGAACLKNYSLRDLMFVMNATLLRHGMGSCSLTRAAGFVRWR
jgi:hypothetical protein